MSEAWVSLATTDGYAQGVLVLAHSLRRVATTKKIHVMVTNQVSSELRNAIAAVADDVTTVDILDSNDAENLRLIGRPDLGVTFTKLHCWRLTQYTKAVFLDADTLVLQNSDELFERDELSAVADIGWPDFFNSGVFVFTPSNETYRDGRGTRHAKMPRCAARLMNFALTNGSFDGGDQGLLNAFFSDWFAGSSTRLSFIYNMTSGTFYTYAAAYKKLGANVKIVHFIGAEKPWHRASASSHQSEHLQQWHSIHREHVARHTKETTPTVEERMAAWARNEPDYMGRDSFENILKTINSSLQ